MMIPMEKLSRQTFQFPEPWMKEVYDYAEKFHMGAEWYIWAVVKQGVRLVNGKLIYKNNWYQVCMDTRFKKFINQVNLEKYADIPRVDKPEEQLPWYFE